MPRASDILGEVRSYALPLDANPFDELFASVRFEETGKGRRGAVLTKVDAAGNVPLVRTTTRYGSPAQRFRPAHDQLAEQIRQTASLPLGFNNALVEVYTNAYGTIGSHSDQALDLADGSFIAVFSCYQHPERADPPRTLVVESKEPGGGDREIAMTHNGVVVFSVDANRRLKHKIVLAGSARAAENRWLGLTFRTSKTFARYRDGRAYLADETILTLADDEQSREFFRLRGRENRETDFAYPPIHYTISDSDLMPPSPAGNPASVG